MPVTLRIKNIDAIKNRFRLMQGARPTVRMGVIIQGPAAAYALVWEWGYATRIIKPGPKTTWGTNPNGERKVLTKTAPSGYIRVNKDKYRQFVREEFAKVNWNRVKPDNFEANVEKVLRIAAGRCAELIAETAPFDTGQLHDAITAARIDQVTGDVTDVFVNRGRIRRPKIARRR